MRKTIITKIVYLFTAMVLLSFMMPQTTFAESLNQNESQIQSKEDQLPSYKTLEINELIQGQEYTYVQRVYGSINGSAHIGIVLQLLKHSEGGDIWENAKERYDNFPQVHPENIMLLLYYDDTKEAALYTGDNLGITFSQAEIAEILKPLTGSSGLVEKRVVEALEKLYDAIAAKGSYEPAAKMVNRVQLLKNKETRQTFLICTVGAISICALVLIAVYIKKAKKKPPFWNVKRAIALALSICVLGGAIYTSFYLADRLYTKKIETMKLNSYAMIIGREGLIELFPDAIFSHWDMFESIYDEHMQKFGDADVDYFNFSDGYSLAYYTRYTSKELAQAKYDFIENFFYTYDTYSMRRVDGNNYKLLIVGVPYGEEFEGYMYFLLVDDAIYNLSQARSATFFDGLFNAMGIDIMKVKTKFNMTLEYPQ